MMKLYVHPDNKKLGEQQPFTVAVDADGTIFTYDGEKAGKPYPGVVKTLQRLRREGARIIIWTQRHDHDVAPELGKYKIPYDEINTNSTFLVGNTGKPHADIFIDDKAMTFDGSWKGMYAKIKRFRPHWKKSMQHYLMVKAIPNGKAKGHKPSEFDAKDLAIGTKHELEHTTSRKVARRIAMDHLIEDPDYYRKLKRIEKGLEKFHGGKSQRVRQYRTGKPEGAGYGFRPRPRSKEEELQRMKGHPAFNGDVNLSMKTLRKQFQQQLATALDKDKKRLKRAVGGPAEGGGSAAIGGSVIRNFSLKKVKTTLVKPLKKKHMKKAHLGVTYTHSTEQ